MCLIYTVNTKPKQSKRKVSRMKKSVKVIVLSLIAIMMVVGLSSCGERNKFVGTWAKLDSDGNRTDEMLVLAKNGEGSLSGSSDIVTSVGVKWSVEKDRLFLTASACGLTESYEYTYSFEGNKMILKTLDGDVESYIKR